MNDKINQFVPEHLFSVKISNEKTNVVALDLFPTQNDEIFGPTHHESGKFMAQEFLNFVSLLDGDGHPDAVDGGLDENPLLIVSGYDDRVQEQLRGLLHLDFWFVVTFNFLRTEVFQAHGSLQSAFHA